MHRLQFLDYPLLTQAFPLDNTIKSSWIILDVGCRHEGNKLFAIEARMFGLLLMKAVQVHCKIRCTAKVFSISRI